MHIDNPENIYANDLLSLIDTFNVPYVTALSALSSPLQVAVGGAEGRQKWQHLCSMSL